MSWSIRIGALVVGSVALIATAQPAKGPGAGPPPAMPVKVVAAKLASAVDEANAVGTLRADESVVIRPEIAGRIAEFRFDEGQGVKKGALLVTLDASEVRAQLASAKAQAQLDAQRLERAEDLRKKNFISQQALDDAREAYRKATARRQEDEARLAKTDIRAPFAGTMGLRQVSVGAYLRAGDDIVRLDRIDALKLDFRVPEVFLGRLGREQPLALRVDAFPGDSFTGRIYALETTVDEKTRTALARARVANPGGKLKPGMFARVTVVLSSRANAVLVPEQALVPRGDRSFVFKVVDGKAVLAEVAIGSRNPGEVEITKGVAAGEIVVTDGQLKLQNGTPVMVVPEKAPAAAPK